MTTFSETQWEQIILKYNRPLVGYFQAVVPCSKEAAEDLAQDTWLKVFKQYYKEPSEGGYDPSIAGFYTYVKQGFARYLAMQKRRELGKNREVILEENTRGDKMSTQPGSEIMGPESIILIIEENKDKLNSFIELLRLLFLCGGYPHQQLAFGYSQTIYGRQSNRGIEGNPARVDRECGNKPLKNLSEAFLDDYISESEIDDPYQLERVKSCLQPLSQRLTFSVADLMQHDHASLKHYKMIHQFDTAQTCLRDYYAAHKKGYTSAIPDWCSKVTRKIKSCLDTQLDLKTGSNPKTGPYKTGECPIQNRCKLRHLPPCNTGGSKLQCNR